MNQLKHISGVILLMLVVFFITCKKDNVSRPPIAKAGADQIILLPINTVTLSGEGSGDTDPNDSIKTYHWEKLSGPPSCEIISSFSKTTLVKNLQLGIYHFELKVTDVVGLSSTDTVQVSVNATGEPPIANAGRDTAINLLFCHDQSGFIELDGSGSFDPDHTPLTFHWSKIKGPDNARINSPYTSKTRIEGISAGDYGFELLVSDAGGKSSRDTVLISATGTPTVYDLNTSMATNYTFQDNLEDCNYIDCSYIDEVKFSGQVNIQPLGEFYINIDESSDSSNIGEGHSTSLNFYNGNGNQSFLTGECLINFKRIIVSGGG